MNGRKTYYISGKKNYLWLKAKSWTQLTSKAEQKWLGMLDALTLESSFGTCVCMATLLEKHHLTSLQANLGFHFCLDCDIVSNAYLYFFQCPIKSPLVWYRPSVQRTVLLLLLSSTWSKHLLLTTDVNNCKYSHSPLVHSTGPRWLRERFFKKF